MIANEIVVGYDGSAGSRAGLDWAVRRARRLQLPLRVVHTMSVYNPLVAGFGQLAIVEDSELAVAAKDLMVEAQARVARSAPDLVVSTEILVGAPGPALLDVVASAESLVVGFRPHGRVFELLLGSTSSRVTADAGCPVVVARPDEPAVAPGPEAGRVVVGLDDSPASLRALGFAVSEAREQGLELTVVHSWSAPVLGRHLPHRAETRRSAAEAGQAAELRSVLDGLCGSEGSFGEVESRLVLTKRPAAEALVDASAGARMVVIGSRGRGALGSIVLGSVSHTVLQHAHCPVAVLHPAQVREPSARRSHESSSRL
jgi:nucleotide-binding universal stress UspA family protein